MSEMHTGDGFTAEEAWERLGAVVRQATRTADQD